MSEEEIEKTEPKKKKRTVFPKELFLATSGDDRPLSETSCLMIVGGPFNGIPHAKTAVETLLDGEYQLVYMGRKLVKKSKTTSVVEEV